MKDKNAQENTYSGFHKSLNFIIFPNLYAHIMLFLPPEDKWNDIRSLKRYTNAENIMINGNKVHVLVQS